METKTEQELQYKLIRQHVRPSIPDVLPLAKLLGITDAWQLFDLHERISILWQDNFAIRE